MKCGVITSALSEVLFKDLKYSTEAQFILAQAEMGLGNLHVAEQWMKKVIEKYPDHKSAVAALPMLHGVFFYLVKVTKIGFFSLV